MDVQDTIQTRRHRHEAVQWNDRNIARNEEEKMLATVPSRVVRSRDGASEPDPETYRQALKSMLEIPEVENRLSYITAALIVSVFGGWLGVRLTRTRAFALVVDLTLFFSSLALAAFFVGVMLGEGFLPLSVVPVLLFLFAVIALLIMGSMLGSMVRTAAAKRRARSRGDHLFRKAA
jgi:uncharacterized membrane protein